MCKEKPRGAWGGVQRRSWKERVLERVHPHLTLDFEPPKRPWAPVRPQAQDKGRATLASLWTPSLPRLREARLTPEVGKQIM